ncbi:hypothetical protein COL5a_007971 [Colletotrichum fioriniae]|nr:hypothetical protein COL5a_007971 [Colletotrichum fioriniae]
MRQTVEEEMLAVFKSHYDFEAKRYALMALDGLFEYNDTRFQILTAAAANKMNLSNDEIERKIVELNTESDESVEEQDEIPEEHANPFNLVPGQRLVNIDPQDGHMVFDIKDWVKTLIDGFAGIFAVLDELHLQESVDSITVYGVPEAFFIHALLWTPAAKISRRQATVPPQSDVDVGDQPNPRFPSWSGAGWGGPVDYRLFEGVQHALDRPESLVRKFKLDG